MVDFLYDWERTDSPGGGEEINSFGLDRKASCAEAATGCYVSVWIGNQW